MAVLFAQSVVATFNHINSGDIEGGGLDDDTIVIDLDRTLSMPPPPLSGGGARNVDAEEIDGPSDGSAWFHPSPQQPARPGQEQQRTSQPPPSSPSVTLPMHSNSGGGGTSAAAGSGGESERPAAEVAGAAAIAAVVTFLQELAGLAAGVTAELPQRWRDMLPAICAVVFGLLCRFISVRQGGGDGDAVGGGADAGRPGGAAPEVDVGV